MRIPLLLLVLATLLAGCAPRSSLNVDFTTLDRAEVRVIDGYKGKVIDHQYHMGIDLASLALSPIPAANAGKVVFAEQLGIYGQTVILDHGFGLFTLYGHCSSLDVTVGQVVARGDTIAKTGTTGLAGGDHLHYGMLVGSTYVNPIEWWDAKWIENNITSKLKALPK